MSVLEEVAYMPLYPGLRMLRTLRGGMELDSDSECPMYCRPDDCPSLLKRPHESEAPQLSAYPTAFPYVSPSAYPMWAPHQDVQLSGGAKRARMC